MHKVNDDDVDMVYHHATLTSTRLMSSLPTFHQMLKQISSKTLYSSPDVGE